jgi:hypothetical protein
VAVNQDIARGGTGDPTPRTGEPALRIIHGCLSPNVRQTTPEDFSDVASILRRARRRRKITLEAAAEATRLPRKALVALEASGAPEDLPEPPYDRYFLREYARYLGLDERPLLAVLDPPDDSELDIATEYLAALAPARRWPVWLLVAGSVAALLTLAIFRLAPDGSRPGDQLAAGGHAVTQAPRSQSPATTAPAAPEGHGVAAVLRLSANCWIQATVDGRTIAGKTVGSGTTLRYRAGQTLDLVLGNGGGVRLMVNGHEVPTGSDGQVVRLSFAWANGRLTHT